MTTETSATTSLPEVVVVVPEVEVEMRALPTQVDINTPSVIPDITPVHYLQPTDFATDSRGTIISSSRSPTPPPRPSVEFRLPLTEDSERVAIAGGSLEFIDLSSSEK